MRLKPTTSPNKNTYKNRDDGKVDKNDEGGESTDLTKFITQKDKRDE